MEAVRQGFQSFSSRLRGFFGGLLSRGAGLCQSSAASTSVPVPVDISGATLLDVSGVDLSGSVVNRDPVVLNSDVIKALPKILKECDIEDSKKCKGCDCSVNTCKAEGAEGDKTGLKLLVPAGAV